MRIALTLFALTLLLTGCGKEKIDDHPDFVGSWVNDDGSGDVRYIDIEQSGNAKYIEEGVFTGYTEVTGKFKIKNGNLVKIGIKKLSLDQYPFENSNGDGEMTLDGDVYLGK